MGNQLLIRNLEKPLEKNLESDIDWICSSFGFYEDIDREKTASKIFKELINSMVERNGLTSTSLGEDSNVTRGAALNHLKKMISAGLVIRKGNRYVLRSSSMTRTMREVRRDIDRVFEDLMDIASEIDEMMGIQKR